MVESLHCSSEIITTLLISYTSIQNLKLKKKKKKENSSPNNSDILMCGPLPIPVVTSHGGWSRITTIPLEAPANPAGRSSPRTLPLPRLPCRLPLRSLPPYVPSVSVPGAPAQHSSEVLRELPSPTSPTVALRGTIQEGRLSPGETQTPSNTGASPV